MKAIFHPDSSFLLAYQTRCQKHRDLLRLQVQTPLIFPVKDRGRWIRGKRICLTAKAELDWATMDQLGLSESDIQSPAISTSYRSLNLPKPNQTVLEAQARVCTGPTQTRPLGEEQAFKVLDTILRSGTYFLLYLFFLFEEISGTVFIASYVFIHRYRILSGEFGAGGESSC